MESVDGLDIHFQLERQLQCRFSTPPGEVVIKKGMTIDDVVNLCMEATADRDD